MTTISKACWLISLTAIGLIVGSVPARAQGNIGAQGYYHGFTSPIFGDVRVGDGTCGTTPIGLHGSDNDTGKAVDATQVYTCVNGVAVQTASATALTTANGVTSGWGDAFFARPNPASMTVTMAGTVRYFFNTTDFALGSSGAFAWGVTTSANSTHDVLLFRESPGYKIQRNAANAQRDCLANAYSSSTSFETFCADWQTTSNVARVGTRTGAAGGTSRALYLSAQAASASANYAELRIAHASPFVFNMIGAAAQEVFTQTTTPTCTAANNCGTGNGTFATGSSDVAGSVTLGTTPASGFVITFNGTWSAPPVCNVWMNKAGMVAGKMVLTPITTTTTITVTTNGTAPATGDIYAYRCTGLQP